MVLSSSISGEEGAGPGAVMPGPLDEMGPDEEMQEEQLVASSIVDGNAEPDVKVGICEGREPSHITQRQEDTVLNIKETMDLVECPICYQYLTPPVFQCAEGHAICSECSEKVVICPTCRSGQVNIRCRALDRLANSIGEMPCRYAAMGCAEKLRLSALRDHERNCFHRTFECIHPETGCRFEGAPGELVSHLIKQHGYEERQTSHIQFAVNVKSLRSFESSHSEGHCVWQRHHYILRVHRRAEGDPQIFISLMVVHPRHHSNMYQAYVEGNHRKFFFSGPVWSLRKEFREVERVRDCLTLADNIALFLSGGKGSEHDWNLLNFTVHGEIFP